jgi:hypothetical protein
MDRPAAEGKPSHRGKGVMRETIPMHKELKKGLEAYLKKRLGGRS